MKYQNFKIRASAGCKLMTEPRAKSETLSETTKSYLKEWAICQMFNVQNEIKSKYTERGIQDEDKAIDLMMTVLDLPFTIKNEQYFENDYFCGTPDLIVGDTVYDIKCSWSAFTFPYFEKEIPNSDYFYQLQTYMALTGCRKAVLSYVLLDNKQIGHEYKIDDKTRIKTFSFEYDPEVIETLQNKVLQSRDYLKNIL
jgi:hypothetical protein